MRRQVFNFASALSLLLFIATVLPLTGAPGGRIILRDGGGGVGGGSRIATYAFVWDPSQIGVGWTHSDVWFKGMIGGPTWLVALLWAVLPIAWLIVRARGEKNASPPDPGE